MGHSENGRRQQNIKFQFAIYSWSQRIHLLCHDVQLIYLFNILATFNQLYYKK